MKVSVLYIAAFFGLAMAGCENLECISQRDCCKDSVCSQGRCMYVFPTSPIIYNTVFSNRSLQSYILSPTIK